MQILNAAFIAGLLMFVGVTIFLYFTAAEPKVPQGKMKQAIEHLSIANAVVFILSSAAGFFIFRSRLAPIAKACSDSPHASPIDFLGELRGAFILRLAMLEGPGLLGTVVCFFGVTGSEIHDHPIYWLNLLSPIAAITFMGVTFPTQEKLSRLFLDEEQSLYR
ncbi:MAG: hypothetical protein MK138_01650 [Planctomycetes bacterium]|nr:hypothetical protein [Planctomycetota bacterium]